MAIGKWAHSAEAAIIFVSRVLNNIATVILVAMMLMTVADVFLRYVLNRPILGTVEITKYTMVCLAFLGMAWCAVKKGNVKVDLVVTHFPPRVQAIFDSITCFFCLVVYCLISGYGFREASYRWHLHEASEILQVPSYPFYLVLGIGSTILCLVLLTDLVRFAGRAARL